MLHTATPQSVYFCFAGLMVLSVYNYHNSNLRLNIIQNNNSNSYMYQSETNKRVSLNESFNNIFDTLSAANNLIKALIK